MFLRNSPSHFADINLSHASLSSVSKSFLPNRLYSGPIMSLECSELVILVFIGQMNHVQTLNKPDHNLQRNSRWRESRFHQRSLSRIWRSRRLLSWWIVSGMTNFWGALYSNRANVIQSKFRHLSDRQKLAKIFIRRKVQHVKDLPTSSFIPTLKNSL